jgi:hypothetical protein
MKSLHTGKSLRKVGAKSTDFHGTQNHGTKFVDITYTELYPKREKNEANGKIF